MSRKSILYALGGIALLGVVAAISGVLLLRHEPAFYREAAQLAGAERKQHSNEFFAQFSNLVSALKEDREWVAHFTDEQINCYLAEGFRTSGVEEKMLPDDIVDPRIRIDGDRLRIGFRYGSGSWSSVVSIDLRAWVAAGAPNVVALELVGMKAGAVPISAQSLLEHVSEAARQQGIDVTWYRYRGNPVALLRFQARRTRTTVQLQQMELDNGKLLLQGRSVDTPPVRTSLPTTSSD